MAAKHSASAAADDNPLLLLVQLQLSKSHNIPGVQPMWGVCSIPCAPFPPFTSLRILAFCIRITRAASPAVTLRAFDRGNVCRGRPPGIRIITMSRRRLRVMSQPTGQPNQKLFGPASKSSVTAGPNVVVPFGFASPLAPPLMTCCEAASYQGCGSQLAKLMSR